MPQKIHHVGSALAIVNVPLNSEKNHDLEEILVFIARDKPDAAVSWVDKIEAKCVAIAANPETGDQLPNLGRKVRGSPIGRYMVFHRFVDGRLEILRVIPGGADVDQL